MRQLVGPCEGPSIRHQCELLEIWRSGWYYEATPESAENLALMLRLDQLHMDHPVYGSRRLRKLLDREGWSLNRKRVARLMGLMGIEAIYPCRRGSCFV